MGREVLLEDFIILVVENLLKFRRFYGGLRQ